MSVNTMDHCLKTMELAESGCILDYTLQLDQHKKIFRQVTFSGQQQLADWLSAEWIDICSSHPAWITKLHTDIPVMFNPPLPKEEKIHFIDSTPYDNLEKEQT